jgi:hypothetical protein
VGDITETFQDNILKGLRLFYHQAPSSISRIKMVIFSENFRYWHNSLRAASLGGISGQLSNYCILLSKE